MSKTIEFFFDFGSPTTYLANTQLPKLAEDCGTHLVYRPILLGGVFKATGNASPVTVPAKGRWMGVDIQRWAKHYGVPFAFNPHFPINTLPLMRGACGMQSGLPAVRVHAGIGVDGGIGAPGLDMLKSQVFVHAVNRVDIAMPVR